MRELMPAVIVAPMAGGPSTVELVVGAGRAGGLGLLAAGYKTPAAVEDELRGVGAAGVAYGLNIFVPMPPPPDLVALERYRGLLQPEAVRYGVELPSLRVADDDHFAAKVELAAAYRVPLVSFTFGIPDEETVRMLRGAGCRVLVTVTNPREAQRALAAQPDALICQAGTAGGHSATTDPAGYPGLATTVPASYRGAVATDSESYGGAAATGPEGYGDIAATGSEGYGDIAATGSEDFGGVAATGPEGFGGVAATGSAGYRGVAATGPEASRGAATTGPEASGGAATTGPADCCGSDAQVLAVVRWKAAADLLAAVRVVAGGVPLVAAGGAASVGDVAALRAAGALAVQCGTAFLLADEAGTRPVQRAAMLSGDYRETVVTRAFTGHPARALRNRFTDAYTAVAPIGYPAVHHLTAPIRAAAASRGDAGALNLWAGTGHASTRPAPVAALVDELTPS